MIGLRDEMWYMNKIRVKWVQLLKVKLTDFLLGLNRIAYLLLRFRAVGQAKMPGLAERNWTQITYYPGTWLHSELPR